VAGSKLYDLCDSALRRLGTLTSEVHPEEHTRFGLLLGVLPSSCSFHWRWRKRETGVGPWKKSLPVFDARIASLPLEESASLWDCRKVVGVKYSDYQTKIPGCEPPIIVSLALATLEDVSTKDSRYADLVSLEVGTHYEV
jgi:hypothetical protein